MYLCMNDCVVVRAMFVLIISFCVICFSVLITETRMDLYTFFFYEINTFTLVVVKNVPHKYFNFTHKKVSTL